MTADEGLAVLEGILDSEYLSQTQVVVFRQAWAGQSYVEIAIATGYDPTSKPQGFPGSCPSFAEHSAKK